MIEIVFPIDQGEREREIEIRREREREIQRERYIHAYKDRSNDRSIDWEKARETRELREMKLKQLNIKSYCNGDKAMHAENYPRVRFSLGVPYFWLIKYLLKDTGISPQNTVKTLIPLTKQISLNLCILRK